MSIVLSTLTGLFMRTIQFLISFLPVLFFIIWLHTRDLLYTAANFFRPSRRARSVVPPGHPGHRGTWPDYIAPVQGRDSRSPCPGLNALANHNILPHNGKHITYKQISHAVQHAYNLSPTLAEQLTVAAGQLDQGRGWINLHDLNALNVIQHDASFTRPDIAFCPDQSVPDLSLVESLISYSSNGKILSIKDLATYSGDRRAACKQANGQYSLTHSFRHKFFGSGNAALIFAIFGGEVEDLRTWLSEERLPYGWQPKNREAFGHTIAQAQLATLAIEFNIDEKQKQKLCSNDADVLCPT